MVLSGGVKVDFDVVDFPPLLGDFPPLLGDFPLLLGDFPRLPARFAWCCRLDDFCGEKRYGEREHFVN